MRLTILHTNDLLLANFEPVVGAVPAALLGEVGVFVLTAAYRHLFPDTDWGWEALDEIEVARRSSAQLRAEGASFVVLLSHLGLSTPEGRWDDGGWRRSGAAREGRRAARRPVW